MAKEGYKTDREEILAKSRRESESRNSDEMELSRLDRCGRYSALVGVLVCLGVIIADCCRGHFYGGFHLALAVELAICSTLLLTKFQKSRKFYQLAAGLLEGAAGIVFLAFYFVGYR